MNEPGIDVLMNQATVQRRIDSGRVPDWGVEHYESFRDGLLGERNDAPFPCYFGIETEREGDGLYSFCSSMADKDALLALGDTIIEYLDVYENHAERAPLTVFFEPPEESLDESGYHEALWHILQFLHVHDLEPWPERIPTDPDSERWEFCFGGESMFLTCRAPFYEGRKNRYCPVGLEITFQPHALFKGVSADTQAGQTARKVIQERMEDCDGVCPHADLGDWGVEGDREWAQYLFSEDEQKAPDECPIRITREHPKSTFLIDA
ncbi:YqcI/YcgG family protein [Haladaptatus cibarius]|uniref:YqcI/YcgG family protein n=1 Tax=Haladaptatus cibarius TaxID=453847 RepID=UPI0006797D4D|nr:YqcI/YcgG family protein [Haladaptatus cibarius]